jgi:hypothetical protein
MKLTFSIFLTLCLSAQAQTNSSSSFEVTSGGTNLVPRAALSMPIIDTNAIAIARAAAFAFMATNIPVVVPMVTNTIETFPYNYPASMPVGANMMDSTNCLDWRLAGSFDISRHNFLSFTNPASEKHFFLIVLMPPQIISISNSFTPTNSVSPAN